MKSIRVGLLFWPFSITATIVGTLFLAFSWPFRGTVAGMWAASEIPRMWGEVVLWSAGLKLVVEGIENVGDGPYVFVVHHSSLLDIPAVLAALRGVNFRIVSRPKFFRIPVLGWAMRLADHIELDRGNRRGSLEAIKALAANFERGQSVLIYGEGKRSPDGEVLEFKPAASVAAILNGVPIVPVMIWGTHVALPKGKLFPHSSIVAVRIGDPIPTASLKRSGALQLTRDTHDWVATAIHPLGMKK